MVLGLIFFILNQGYYELFHRFVKIKWDPML